MSGEKDDTIFFMKLLMIYKYVYLFYELESETLTIYVRLISLFSFSLQIDQILPKF